MGMMNVLMQLRKVCNHPDLFEPRSVVTPFVVDPIGISLPSCVFALGIASHPLCRVSEQLTLPLWCGSTSEPDLDAACRHDTIEAGGLAELGEILLHERFCQTSRAFEAPFSCDECLPPALCDLLSRLHQKAWSEDEAKLKFFSNTNKRRCHAPPFAYPHRLIESLKVVNDCSANSTHDALSSPAALLAARRSQQQRANDIDDLVKKFVFCVPKAGAQSPRAPSDSRNSLISEKIFDSLLREPAEEAMRPFRTAQARLSSFFPDKKLIQYDAGKLQTLAELLRELKRGGHRVLIFTQMSKMLDILEAFLNLNGHTYLRLDGSTGVDRRQRLMDRFNSDAKVRAKLSPTFGNGIVSLILFNFLSDFLLYSEHSQWGSGHQLDWRRQRCFLRQRLESRNGRSSARPVSQNRTGMFEKLHFFILLHISLAQLTCTPDP